MNVEIPGRLYKYRSPSVQNITSLSDGKIWFSSPATFNDPFDCAYEIVLTNLTRADCVSMLTVASSGQLTEASLAQFTDDVLLQQVETALKTVVNDGLSKIGGVSCFSEIHDDLLMWGHYSDGHRGFCLEFDTTGDPLFKIAKQVRYSDSFPQIDIRRFATYDFAQILDLVLTKATCWNYEKEWRVLHAEAAKSFGYDRSSLIGIYFGAKMPDEQIRMISALLETSDAKLYKMHLDKSLFKLVPEAFTFTRLDYRRR